MGPRNGKERQALKAGMLNRSEFTGGQNSWSSAGVIGQSTGPLLCAPYLNPTLSNPGVPR
jgi:hypothetical protein